MDSKSKTDLIEITCNLRKDDPSTNQLIYCSQLYGTFFCVGAKLNVKKNKLLNMELRLLNFKGLYNIGILDQTKFSFEKHGEDYLLTLHLKANSQTHGNNKPVMVDCKEVDISNNPSLFVTRFLHPLYEGDEQLEQGLFDSEFYVRDGAYVNTNDMMKSENESENNESPDDRNFTDGYKDGMFLTLDDRCKTTKAKFI